MGTGWHDTTILYVPTTTNNGIKGSIKAAVLGGAFLLRVPCRRPRFFFEEMSYLWVLLLGTPRAVKITLPPTCEDVDGLIELIKAKLTPKLDTVALSDITLHTTYDTPKLRPGLLLSDIPQQIGYITNSDENPLVVKAGQQRQGISLLHMRT